MAPNGLEGLTVAAFESRMATEMANLITRFGGTPLVAPSMQEIPLEDNTQALEFGEQLMAGDIQLLVFLTGVGTRTLMDVLETRWSHADILQFYQSSLIDDARPFEKDQQTLSLIGLARAALSNAIWNFSNNPRRTSQITSREGFSFVHPTLGKSNLTIEEHTDDIYTLTLTATETVDPHGTW